MTVDRYFLLLFIIFSVNRLFAENFFDPEKFLLILTNENIFFGKTYFSICIIIEINYFEHHFYQPFLTRIVVKGGVMYKMKFLYILVIPLVFIYSGISFAGDEEISLKVGDAAPEFVLNNQDGELWNTKDYIGKKRIVVYFYPAAMTGGCTKQACSYRDAKSELDGKDIVVVGISSDAVKNLKIFQQAYQLNFNLLSDATGEVARKFGVPIEEGATISREVGQDEIALVRSYTLYRWTFVIDKQGKIAYIDKEVEVAEEGNNILKFFEK